MRRTTAVDEARVGRIGDVGAGRRARKAVSHDERRENRGSEAQADRQPAPDPGFGPQIRSGLSTQACALLGAWEGAHRALPAGVGGYLPYGLILAQKVRLNDPAEA